MQQRGETEKKDTTTNGEKLFCVTNTAADSVARWVEKDPLTLQRTQKHAHGVVKKVHYFFISSFAFFFHLLVASLSATANMTKETFNTKLNEEKNKTKSLF